MPLVSTPRARFRERRDRLDRALAGPKLFVSGLRRPRNFAHNPYPFRAESHFLYFAGVSLEGAALLVDGDRTTLFVDPPHADEALFTGPRPSLTELEETLEQRVRPLSEFRAPGEVAVIPPQDAETAFALADLVERDIEAGGGDRVEGRDAALADAVISLRLRHDDAAIAQLRWAAEVTARAHEAGKAAVRPGVRESEVRAAMEHVMIAQDMTPAYASIVTTHGEVLHANDYHRELRPGDLLLCDVGAETREGWAGDVTRVWPVSGRFSTTQQILFDVVLAAQEAAIAAVRPGARFRDVHRVAGLEIARGLVAAGILRGDAEDLYHRGAAALFFPHGVGHLLGLDVHDMEDLGDRAGYAPGRARSASLGERYLRLDRDLEPGMCVTVEPGYYRHPLLLEDREVTRGLRDAIDFVALEKFSDVRGIRLEDDVLVESDGCEVLTRAIPKV